MVYSFMAPSSSKMLLSWMASWNMAVRRTIRCSGGGWDRGLVVGRLVEMLVERLVEALVGRSVEATVGRLVEALVGSLVEVMVGSLVEAPVGRLVGW